MEGLTRNVWFKTLGKKIFQWEKLSLLPILSKTLLRNHQTPYNWAVSSSVTCHSSWPNLITVAHPCKGDSEEESTFPPIHYQICRETTGCSILGGKTMNCCRISTCHRLLEFWGNLLIYQLIASAISTSQMLYYLFPQYILINTKTNLLEILRKIVRIRIKYSS